MNYLGETWLVSVIIGTAFAAGKGQIASGLVWTIVFGPLGILVILFLPNLKKKEQARQKEEFDQLARLQRVQLDQIKSLSSRPLSQPRRPLPLPRLLKPELSYRVARNGEDIGEMPLTKINALLRAGKLTKADYYFDAQVNEWVALEFLCGVSELNEDEEPA